MFNNKYQYIVLLSLMVLLVSCKNESDSKPVEPINEEISVEPVSETVVQEKSGFLQVEKDTISKNYYDDTIVGFWNSGFPVSAGLSGYYFSEKGYFLYFDYNDISNIRARYSGSLGIWNTDNNQLILDITHHFYWAKDYVETPFGYTVKKDNYLTVVSGNRENVVIGNLNTIKTADEIPQYMEMKIIQNSHLSLEPIELFHIYLRQDLMIEIDSIEGKEPIDLFQEVFAEINS